MGKLDTDVSFEVNLHDLYKERSVGEVAKIISSMMMYKIEHHGKTLSEWMDLIVGGKYEPVKHGKWIDITKIRWVNETNVPVVMCTECGIRFCDLINNHHYMYHYCPNCGARMDGAIDED